ncbi:hypothetical protein JZ751_011241 [Albula glossodonta]|uniref:PROP1-like PPR domain-containing protein n=1 Tax=Albula glossodonta TaxID=121402 RepID=A0A8T2NWM2_9TELE|nr:hypothetical protein JZ751_011241 [Albula glossodonta]
MAALLRTARLLKLSPASLLQISGANIHVSAVSRLCSRSSVCRGVGIHPAQVQFLPGVNRLQWPCAGLRHFVVAPNQQGVSSDEGGSAVRTKQAQQFDLALTKMDSSVRRTGRITKTLLLSIFSDICRSGYPSVNQALLLLRSCGTLLPEVPLSERTELAHQIWDKLQELGVSYDASHYNALLKVYLQNEFKFSPTDFLAKMEAANVQPNRVTYQRLIAAYCQEGDIEGASQILGFMKTKDLPITEAVFNSLITGHARAGDMESAENILAVMRGAGIEPGPDTYLALLSAYAEKGDMDKIRELLGAIQNSDSSLMDRDFMQLLFSLAKAGHHQHVPEIIEHLKRERGYVPDAMNLCMSLITQGLEDTAFTMLKTIPTLQAENGESPSMGNFFLRHCVDMEKPVEKLQHFCKELQDSGLHSTALRFTLFCALEAKKTGMAVQLMKVMKEQGLPVRPHYFWPLLTQHQKDNNTQGIVEVLKGMQDLEVLPDISTFSTYVLPSFSSVESARSALKEAGCSLDTEPFIASQLRMEASNGNLKELLDLLSSQSVPAIDLSNFRGNVIQGFKKSSDVDSMAKITDLLYRDARFCPRTNTPAESVSYLLYNLIDGMSGSEVQAQEEKLRQYFHQLKAMNITISVNIHRGIQKLLDSYNVPELIKDVIALVDSKEGLGSMDIPRGHVEKVEKKYEELKAANQPLGSTLKQLIILRCAEEKLDQALELKTQHEAEMVIEGYAVLINACCRHDKVEEALNLKRELDRMDSSVVLDTNKYLALVKALSRHGKLDESLDILKEMKEKAVPVKDSSVAFFHVLNNVALRGESDTVKRLQEAIFSLGLAKPTNSLCAPLVTSHLERGDHAAALDAVLECQKQYGRLPRLHEVLCLLVEKGETELLQKAMDVVSQERGEMTMLYDLLFAFIQLGKYREARKIIETPGLRARPGRLQWYAEKCISSNQMEPLENLVDMTSKLFECDRDEMYHYILRLCSDTNDWHKADATWTKMQEENVIPRERTLRLLANIFKKNGQEVPFEVPEIWYEEAAAAPQGGPPEPKAKRRINQSAPVETANTLQLRLLTLCKRGQPEEALNVLKEAEKRNFALIPVCYDNLVKALLAEGNVKDALAVRDIAVSRNSTFCLSGIANSRLIITQVKNDQVEDAKATFKSMVDSDQAPSQLAVTRLVQGLSSHGDLQGIQEVESVMKSLGSSLNLSSMLFINNIALAHIRNGDIDTAMEGLEAFYTRGSEGQEEAGPQVSSMTYVFRRLIEEKNDHALDKLSAMAERLANHFASYRPSFDLFLAYLQLGQTEEAKFLLQRCASITEQKAALISYVARTAQKPGQVDKIKTLLELIPDFTEKEAVYPYIMKCYSQENDLTSAKALYQKMQEEGLVADNLFLKRLAVLYKNAGENVPFEEPPESAKFYAEELRQKTNAQKSTKDD